MKLLKRARILLLFILCLLVWKQRAHKQRMYREAQEIIYRALRKANSEHAARLTVLEAQMTLFYHLLDEAKAAGEE